MSNPNLEEQTMLIMAGGTGGHVFPAMALAKSMQELGWTVEWLGTARGIEAKVVPDAGIKLHCLKIAGVRGRGLINMIKAPFKILHSVYAAKEIIRLLKPKVVVGLGGYAAGPGGIASFLCRVPLAIHEQNAKPGTTNKILANFASAVLTGFPKVFKNGRFIGNPVRKEFLQVEAPEKRLDSNSQPLKILVLGGSLGALALNKCLPEALKKLEDINIEVCHQSGEKHIESTQELYKGCDQKVDLRAFIDDMAERLAWADLVICRSGALTVAELSSVGVASILVPFPFAIDDHQTANAEWLKNAGAAVLCQQTEFSPKFLAEKIKYYSMHREELIDMALAARKIAKPDATEEFTKICLELAHV